MKEAGLPVFNYRPVILLLTPLHNKISNMNICFLKHRAAILSLFMI